MAWYDYLAGPVGLASMGKFGKAAGQLGGMASGAAMGAPFGPIGMGVGAALGGLGGVYAAGDGTGSSMGGQTTPDKVVKLPQYEPWQANIMQTLGQQGAAGLGSLLQQPLDMNALQQQAMQQYQQQIVPDLMSRLSSGPTAGLQRSSAIGQQLGAAGSDLASRLAALRAQVAQQQQGFHAQLFGNMVNTGLNPMYGSIYQPAQYKPGFAESLMPGIGSALGGLGQGLGNYLGAKYMGSGL